MTSINIERFYDTFEKHVILTSAYTDKKHLGSILMMCRMKPYDIIFGSFTKKVILYRRWIDEYGNSLKIQKDKKVMVRLNDLTIDKSKITQTDLYGQVSMEQTARISKLVYFLNGRDEDQHGQHTVLSFLGIDNFLRTFVFIFGEWRRYPSIFLGMQALTDIATNSDVKYYKELKGKKAIIYPCDVQKSWISYWPCKDFVSILRDQNESVLSLLNIKKDLINNA